MHQRHVAVSARAIAHTRDGGEGTPDETECNDIFSFEFDSWYDKREERWVDVLDVDVGELQDWAVGADSTAIVYIHMKTPGYDDPESDGVFPVVRVSNGGTLDYPLTISTRHPLYTAGDYNSGVWQPAALVSDAMTWLSIAWNDAEHQRPYWQSYHNRAYWPDGANTEVNAAILAGHSPTLCDHNGHGTSVNNGNCHVGSDSRNYGGGLENFPRFLEDFRYSGSSTRTMTYTGSLVSLYYNLN